jgi:hypothetical protein
MDADRTGWVPLPYIGDTYQAGRAGVHRDSIGRARRVSNWTAAALIVSTGAAALALAHQALPAIAPASGTAASGTAASGTAAPGAGPGSAAGARGASGPTVTHSVATTSASGVTTTTTTRPVNGTTVVTQVRNVPAHGDS